jgi:DegV family protein with EDD domain
MTKKIAIVTDSTSDIPVDIQQKYGVEVIPLNVIFGDKNYKDGVTIKSKEFFEMLPTAAHHPSTSQPSPGEFVDLYEKVLKGFDSIISIHISSKLSGTCQSAVMASEILSSADITVVDSRTASLGCGMAVIAAAKARNEGASKEEIVALAESVASKQILFITVETLEWLQRNGRIGKASALLGSLLNLRPILKIEDGAVAPHAKIRGKMSKVLDGVVEAAGEYVPHGSKVRIALVHGNVPERAEILANQFKSVYQVEEVFYNEIGPVIGVHVGPGAVGAIVVPV